MKVPYLSLLINSLLLQSFRLFHPSTEGFYSEDNHGSDIDENEWGSNFGSLELKGIKTIIPNIPVKFDIRAVSLDGYLISNYDSELQVVSPSKIVIKDEYIREVSKSKTPLTKGRFSGEMTFKGSSLFQAPLSIEIHDLRGGLKEEKATIQVVPGILTILPPLFAIVLAIISKGISISLLIGLSTGAFIIFIFDPLLGFDEMAVSYIAGSLLKKEHLLVILFSLMLSGMVCVKRNGGGRFAIVERYKRLVKSVRGGFVHNLYVGGDDLLRRLHELPHTRNLHETNHR